MQHWGARSDILHLQTLQVLQLITNFPNVPPPAQQIATQVELDDLGTSSRNLSSRLLDLIFRLVITRQYSSNAQTIKKNDP